MDKTFHFFKWSGKKAVWLLSLTVLVCVLVVDTVLAVLIMRTQTIKNTFPPSEIHISSWSGNDIINSGDAPVYVRALIVVNWVSEEDENSILSVSPEQETDYALTVGDGWFLGTDGFYYYKNSIGAAQTVTLLTDAVQKEEMVGFKLRIRVLSSAIQTKPAQVVEQSWSAIRVAEDGTLKSAD